MAAPEAANMSNKPAQLLVIEPANELKFVGKKRGRSFTHGFGLYFLEEPWTSSGHDD